MKMDIWILLNFLFLNPRLERWKSEMTIEIFLLYDRMGVIFLIGLTWIQSIVELC